MHLSQVREQTEIQGQILRKTNMKIKVERERECGIRFMLSLRNLYLKGKIPFIKNGHKVPLEMTFRLFLSLKSPTRRDVQSASSKTYSQNIKVKSKIPKLKNLTFSVK